MNENEQPKKRGVGTWLLIIIPPLLIGILLSLLIPRPVIGVIKLDDAIYSTSANDMITQIIYAREHPEVRAVVLVMNSPGGTVTDTESVYMELARLRQTKPVITLIEGMAASGGYYLAVGTDYIFAKPASEVGNVGVIGYLPSIPGVGEETYSTGPYKLWGNPRETYIREMEMLKNGFIQAVLLGRDDRLKIEKEEVLRGEIWAGTEALRKGLIDAIGTRTDAYQKAASMAKVAHYKIENLRTASGLPEYSYSPYFFQASEGGVISPYPKEAGVYLLYIPPMEKRP